jgi:hypothetical protein
VSLAPPTTPGSVATERRSAPRLNAGRRVVQVRAATRPAGQGLVALDVSAGGCLVAGSGHLPSVGVDVDVDIAAGPLTPPSRLRARVVRARATTFGRFELGLRFTPRSPEERDVILGWCRELD